MITRVWVSLTDEQSARTVDLLIPSCVTSLQVVNPHDHTSQTRSLSSSTDDGKDPDHNHNHISWGNPSYPQAVFRQLTAGAEAAYNTRVIEWRKKS